MMGSLKSTGLKPKRTSVQAPWQNGIAERWIGSARREILGHVIALNEGHLRRLLREYVAYHQEDRIHDALGQRHAEPAPHRKPSFSIGDGCFQCQTRRSSSSILL